MLERGMQKELKKKNDKLDMARYVIENEAKIDKDISAMVEYGTLVYKGPQRWNEKNNTAIEIYVNDLWVVLLDSKTENVITIKGGKLIPLGVGWIA